MYDLTRRFTSRTVELPDANYYDTSPYAIDKNTDIDLAVDEKGLWAIYATEENNGKIVVSRLDPESLSIIETYQTDFEKTGVMEAWMTCGILYAIEADSDSLLFMFDTNTGRHITGDQVRRIRLPNLPGTTTSLKYDPKKRSLQAWAHGIAITYQLRFQPSDVWPYSTTTKTTTTTTKSTTKSSVVPPAKPLPQNQCKETEIRGLRFPATKFGSKSRVLCHGGSGSASWLCGESPSFPTWVGEPDTSECVSPWMLREKTKIENPGNNKGTTLSKSLLQSVEENENSLRPFDLYIVLEMVRKVHDQNPRLEDSELDQNLLKIIEVVRSSRDTPIWGQLSKSLSSQIENDSISLIQSVLSRLSCKLRLRKEKFDFDLGSNSFKCWLEPAAFESKFPVSIEFSRSVPNEAYRSLIKLENTGKSAMWLGNLHTDCDRPVAEWAVKYRFSKTGACNADGCKTVVQNTVGRNGTVCDCTGNSGPVSLAISGELDGEPVPIVKVDPVETGLMAVLILSALLHGAAGVASLLLKETSLVDIDGLRSAHRAINFLMMVALITVSSTAQHMRVGEMVSTFYIIVFYS